MNDFGGQSFPADTPPTNDEKMMALIAHLGGIIWFVPLIIVLIKKDSRFVYQNAIQALGFALAILIIDLISIPLVCFVGLGAFIMLGAGLVHIGFAILGAVRANEGKFFEYPVTGPFVKAKFP